MNVEFGRIDKIAVFGGSWLTAALIPLLRKQGIPFILFTSARHADEVVTREGKTLRQVAAHHQVEVQISDDINFEPRVASFVDQHTLGIALGAAWVFSPATAALFSGRLLDFMGIPMPQFRGGAHYTWQILQGNRNGSCILQVVHGGLATFHQGEIVTRRDYLFPDTVRIPQDYFDSALREETVFLEEFIAAIKAQHSFPVRELDESTRTYFPFLNTIKQGFVDWRWNTEEIERFICAFDGPYMGATSFIGTRRVHLKDCRADAPAFRGHPFMAGLIFSVNKDSVRVATRDANILIGTVLDADGHNLIPQLNTGDRFYTPQSWLDDAMKFSASYGAHGLES